MKTFNNNKPKVKLDLLHFFIKSVGTAAAVENSRTNGIITFGAFCKREKVSVMYIH